MTTSPATTPAALAVGMTARRSRVVTARDIELFTELTGDRNPLHYYPEKAAASRFGGIIVQGGVTSGLLNAVVAAKHTAIQVDNVAGLACLRPQPLDDIGIASGRHEADVLTVGLFGNGKAQFAGECPRFNLRHRTQRKTQEGELFLRRRKQEIALVAVKIGGPVEAAAGRHAAAEDVVAGRQGVGVG